MRKGNAAAFEEIYRLHFPKVFYYASKYLADDEEARNIAQDTFMELWQRRENIDGTLNIVSYMLTIARNKCLNVLRSNIIRNKYKDNVAKRSMAEMNYYALSDKSAENALGSDLFGTVDKLLDEMPLLIFASPCQDGPFHR